MILLLVACATPPLQERPHPVSQNERVELFSVRTSVPSPGGEARPESELIQSFAAGSPEAERVIGYVGLAAFVLTLTILAIGFYKLARMLGGHS